MSENNPYQSPESDVNQPVEQTLTLHAPRAVDISRGFGWVGDGFDHFKKDAGQWILAMIVGFVILMAIGLLDWVGQIISMVTTYVWIAGLTLGCKAQYEGKRFSMNYLFEGFKEPLIPLISLSILLSLASLLIFYLFVGEQYLVMLTGGPEAEAMFLEGFQNPSEFFSLFLWAFLANIPIMMMGLFAPLLIAIHKVSLIQAVQLSFIGTLKNIVPIILFFIIMSLFMMVSVLGLFIPLIIIVPIFYGGMFNAYKDIFTHQSVEINNDTMTV